MDYAIRTTMLAHADFGYPECVGRLAGVMIDDERASVVCSECGVVVRLVPAADLEPTLNEMQLGVKNN
jgi:hypothetical protein